MHDNGSYRAFAGKAGARPDLARRRRQDRAKVAPSTPRGGRRAGRAGRGAIVRRRLASRPRLSSRCGSSRKCGARAPAPVSFRRRNPRGASRWLRPGGPNTVRSRCTERRRHHCLGVIALLEPATRYRHDARRFGGQLDLIPRQSPSTGALGWLASRLPAGRLLRLRAASCASYSAFSQSYRSLARASILGCAAASFANAKHPSSA
jgi:hypothetical protein